MLKFARKRSSSTDRELMRTKAPAATAGMSGSATLRPRSSSMERTTLVQRVIADMKSEARSNASAVDAKSESKTLSSSAVIRRVGKSTDCVDSPPTTEHATVAIEKQERRNSAILAAGGVGSRTAILAPMTSTLSHLMSQVQINCETMEKSSALTLTSSSTTTTTLTSSSTTSLPQPPPPVLPRRKPKMENPLTCPQPTTQLQSTTHTHLQQHMLPQQLQQLWKVELLDTSGESGYGTDNSDSNSLRSQDSCEPAPPPLPRRKPRRKVQFDSYVLLIQSLKERDMDGILATIFNVSPEALCTEDVIYYFHTAILRQDYEMTELLVRAGAEVNTFDHRGWSALHCACSVARLDMIKLLLQNGAAVLARTHHSSETGTQLLPQDNPAFPQCLAYLRCMEECLGTVNSRIALAAANYKACRVDELSIRKGERLVVIRRGDPNNEMWWWLRNSSGDQGYVLRDLLALNSRYSST